jgi:hypothetical protein
MISLIFSGSLNLAVASFAVDRSPEFRLATPITNIPENAPSLEFAPDASIRPKP